nr:alkaline phosphatase [uncultured Allomuricauda sp.]
MDHKGIMVPLFAYMPKAENFNGVYENTEIFHKILRVLEMK